MEQESFHHWLHVSYKTPTWLWFDSFLCDTLEPSVSHKFDEACRRIEDKFLEFSAAALLNCRNKTMDFYEYKWFHFVCSEEYADICWTSMPTYTLRNVNAGWMILGYVLSDMHRKWIIDGTRNERNKVNSEPFIRDVHVKI